MLDSWPIQFYFVTFIIFPACEVLSRVGSWEALVCLSIQIRVSAFLAPSLEFSHTGRHTYFVSLISWEALFTMVLWVGIPQRRAHILLRRSVQDQACAPCLVFRFSVLLA